LKGEDKSRTHTVSSKEINTTYSENSYLEENIKDAQTSEQFSLERETSNMINKQRYSDTSVNASAKFGAKLWSASVNAGYQTGNAIQTSKAVKNASSYAKEITERAVERVVKRVTESRTRTTIHEITETNTHSLSGGANHTIGIYRWVDKFYKVELFNYGKRLMYQLTVEKPAFNYIKNIQSIPINNLKCPLHPENIQYTEYYDIYGQKKGGEKIQYSETYGLDSFKRLKELNYEFWTSLYDVKDIEPFPEDIVIFKAIEFNKVTATDSDGNEVIKGYHATGNIDIPDGYTVIHAEATLSATSYYRGNIRERAVAYTPNRRDLSHGNRSTESRPSVQKEITDEVSAVDIQRKNLLIILGDTIFHGEEKEEGDKIAFHTKSFPYSYFISSEEEIKPLSHVKIVCIPNETVIQKWQIKLYNAIIEAYEEKKAKYDQEVGQIKMSTQVYGNNPAINRRIEKEEIKKACIDIILAKVAPSFMLQASGIDYHPVAIFIEEAFDWDEITYDFLPYYWNNTRNMVQELQSNDPLFQNFLRASLAKSLLPVKPGFEMPMLHFMNTGKLWNGTETFDIAISDTLLADEIQEIEGKYVDYCEPVMTLNAERKEVPQQWILKVPTNLVVLSNKDIDGELPECEMPKLPS